MTYKCLFTVLTDETLAEETLTNAAAMAAACGAHLDVLCLGVDRTQTGFYYAGASAIVLQETITRASEEASRIAARAEAHLKNADCLWAVESAVAQLADIGRHVSARARFADLVILPKPYGEGRGTELEPVIEAALFEGQAPAIILPESARLDTRPKRIMIGWNEGAEVLSAVRAAMPLLKQAEIVHVVIIDPPAHGPTRSDPGGLLSQYLARHDVKVEIDVLSRTLPRISDVLTRCATDMDADMLVMGAYGHSRFREAIMGGATRDILETAPVPVFMKH